MDESRSKLQTDIKTGKDEIIGENKAETACMTRNVRTLLTKKNAAYLKLQQGRNNRANTEKYKELRRLEKSLHKKKKKSFENKKFENRTSSEIRKFYSLINTARKEIAPQGALCRGTRGNV